MKGAIGVAVFCVLAVGGGTAFAQQPGRPLIQSPIISGVSNCIEESISRGDVTKDGEQIRFGCKGNYAARLFSTLGNLGVQSRENTNTAGEKIRIRDFSSADYNPGYCYQRLELADGEPATGYVCQLYFFIGAIINR